jgi:hypothetical protein
VRKELLLKLAKKIVEDIDACEHERRDMKVREAGFWRYINRTAAGNLDTAHKKFSWATGELKKPKKQTRLVPTDADAEMEGHTEKATPKRTLLANSMERKRQELSNPAAAHCYWNIIYSQIQAFELMYDKALAESRSIAPIVAVATKFEFFKSFRKSFNELCAIVREYATNKENMHKRIVVGINDDNSLKYDILAVPVIALFSEEQNAIRISQHEQYSLIEQANAENARKGMTLKFCLPGISRTPTTNSSATRRDSFDFANVSATLPSAWNRTENTATPTPATRMSKNVSSTVVNNNGKTKNKRVADFSPAAAEPASKKSKKKANTAYGLTKSTTMPNLKSMSHSGPAKKFLKGNNQKVNDNEDWRDWEWPENKPFEQDAQLPQKFRPVETKNPFAQLVSSYNNDEDEDMEEL